MLKETILFLDFDGVLINYDLFVALPKGMAGDFMVQSHVQTNVAPMSISCYGFLNKLCIQHPELSIVCSSTYRTGSREEIDRAFRDVHERLELATGAGEIPQAIRFNDQTFGSWRTCPDYIFDRPRGKAIDKWLFEYGEGIQNYLIIDDDADFYPWQLPFLIQPNGHVGFTINDMIMTQNMIKERPTVKQLQFDFHDGISENSFAAPGMTDKV